MRDITLGLYNMVELNSTNLCNHNDEEGICFDIASCNRIRVLENFP